MKTETELRMKIQQQAAVILDQKEQIEKLHIELAQLQEKIRFKNMIHEKHVNTLVKQIDFNVGPGTGGC
jgi:phosphatidylinositol kinase/protein kinase (PI-3  family)